MTSTTEKEIRIVTMCDSLVSSSYAGDSCDYHLGNIRLI